MAKPLPKVEHYLRALEGTSHRIRCDRVHLHPRSAPEASRRQGAEHLTSTNRLLLCGARPSHEVKCFAVGHASRLVPHSPTSFSARYGPRPLIWVRSTPRIAWRAARASKVGAFF